MSPHTVTRSTLRQQIADALRDEILAGRLQPGQEFTVKEIAEQYGVSATPVREALVDLSAQGLLDSVQHRGFQVHEFSLADYRNLIEARSLIADAMFRGIAVHGIQPAGSGEAGALPDEATEAALLAAVRRRGEEAQRAAVAGDLNVLIGYDLRFWREVGALHGNPYLGDFIGRLRLMSWVCVVPVLRRAGDLRGVLWAGHTELVDALGRRDPDAAHGVIVECNKHALAMVERLLASGVCTRHGAEGESVPGLGSGLGTGPGLDADVDVDAADGLDAAAANGTADGADEGPAGGSG